ncbi:unnamed protein product, partial [Effrenium voratum]
VVRKGQKIGAVDGTGCREADGTCVRVAAQGIWENLGCTGKQVMAVEDPEEEDSSEAWGDCPAKPKNCKCKRVDTVTVESSDTEAELDK